MSSVPTNGRRDGDGARSPRGLRVNVLGEGFRLMDDDSRLAVPPGSERLLAFLALAPSAVSRCSVAGSLWPDASARHAFGNLRSTLARLGTRGREAVHADPTKLELADGVRVDLQETRALALRLLTSTDLRPDDVGLHTVTLLSLDVLSGWYDDWVLVEAEDWRQLRLHALEALAGHLAAAERFGEAVHAAMASVRAEPLRESAHAALIRVHLAEGNRSEAIRQVERLRTVLRAEMGVDPSSRVTGLFRGHVP